MTWLRGLTFLLGSLTATLTVQFFWIYFYLLMLEFVLQWISLHWEILIMFVVSVSIDFPSNSTQDALFHHIAYDFFRADWDGLCEHLRNVPWEDVFKLGASAAISELREWDQVGVYVYVPHLKYQAKPHTSPWFSADCAAAIIPRNQFLVCTNRINLNLK